MPRSSTDTVASPSSTRSTTSTSAWAGLYLSALLNRFSITSSRYVRSASTMMWRGSQRVRHESQELVLDRIRREQRLFCPAALRDVDQHVHCAYELAGGIVERCRIRNERHAGAVGPL